LEEETSISSAGQRKAEEDKIIKVYDTNGHQQAAMDIKFTLLSPYDLDYH